MLLQLNSHGCVDLFHLHAFGQTTRRRGAVVTLNLYQRNLHK